MFFSPRPDPPPTRPRPRLADQPAQPSEAGGTQAGSDDLLGLFPLTEAHRHLPRRPGGKKLHRTTLGRWASKGCRGAVLRTWLVGGIRYTNAEAIAVFVEQLSASREPSPQTGPSSTAVNPPTTEPPPTSTRATISAPRRDRIEGDLDRLGV